MKNSYYEYREDGEQATALRLYIDGAADVAAFKDLVQRGACLAPDIPASMKELADLVTVGHVQQDYKTQETKKRESTMALENVSKTQIRMDGANCDAVVVNENSVLYAQFVQRLVKEMGSSTLNLLHAAVGISGEAGELIDAVKKHWAYGKPLDQANVIEELGDLEFYMCAMRLLMDVTREQVLQANADKLAKRYGDSYSDAAAIARADKAPGS